MNSPSDYAAGTQAALKVINADLANDVPSFFQGVVAEQFTPELRGKLALEISKAVIDAVFAERMEQSKNG